MEGTGDPEQQALFVAGEGGHHTYRIPALVATTRGAVLAFCEGRRDSARDYGEIDLLLRRSTDGGHSFDAPRVVVTQAGWTCGNPAPVVDRETGVVWLLFCKNLARGGEDLICAGEAPRTVWVTHSGDDGVSWTPPVEITAAVKPAGWSWYATGPGHGIQLRHGPRAGRLVVACDHIVLRDRSRADPHHAHVVLSDDHGATWRLGGIAGEGTNESTCVETAGGWLYLNCRNRRREGVWRPHRAVAWSNDGGETFSPLVRDAALPEPVCQASVCRLAEPAPGAPGAVLFSNPAAVSELRGGRNHLTVRLSRDECQTWALSRVLWPGPAAYSDLCVAPPEDAPSPTALCLYERGTDGPYETLTLARLTPEWLAGR
jgi:sialidase-1